MLLVWGLLPEVRRELRRVAASLAGARRRRIIAYVVGPAAVITGISVAAPRYAHELLTREWGLLEPLQFAVYVLIAVLCLDIARLTAPGDAAGPLYRAATWVALALAAEELDYLGIFSLVAEAFGATGGRVRGQYIGALHDLANVAARHVGALTLGGMIVALAALAWLVAGRYRAAIRSELASRSSMPLVLAAILMTLAQLTDIDDRALGDARAAGGLRFVNLLEEPMELVAQLCLLAYLTVKYAERSRRRVGLPGQ
jgi:hypothetical protein